MAISSAKRNPSTLTTNKTLWLIQKRASKQSGKLRECLIKGVAKEKNYMNTDLANPTHDPCVHSFYYSEKNKSHIKHFTVHLNCTVVWRRHWPYDTWPLYLCIKNSNSPAHSCISHHACLLTDVWCRWRLAIRPGLCPPSSEQCCWWHACVLRAQRPPWWVIC
jgi:hypothetical protein